MEVYVLPEMEQAGAEALRESRESGLDDTAQAVAVYMAMRAVFAVAVVSSKGAVVH